MFLLIFVHKTVLTMNWNQIHMSSHINIYWNVSNGIEFFILSTTPITHADSIQTHTHCSVLFIKTTKKLNHIQKTTTNAFKIVPHNLISTIALAQSECNNLMAFLIENWDWFELFGTMYLWQCSNSFFSFKYFIVPALLLDGTHENDKIHAKYFDINLMWMILQTTTIRTKSVAVAAAAARAAAIWTY